MSFMATKVKKAQTKVSSLTNDIRTKAVKIIKKIILGQLS